MSVCWPCLPSAGANANVGKQAQECAEQRVRLGAVGGYMRTGCHTVWPELELKELVAKLSLVSYIVPALVGATRKRESLCERVRL